MQREQLSSDSAGQNEEPIEETTNRSPIETTLTDFSNELLILIFIELPIIDITHLALVCSPFRTIVLTPFFLKEKIKKDLEKKDSLPDWKVNSDRTISTFTPSDTREMEVLSSCLHHPGPDLEHLTGNFPTFASFISALADRPCLQIPWFFRSSPKRVVLHSSYQQGLNYLYTLVNDSIFPWKIVRQHNKSLVLVSGVQRIPCVEEIRRLHFLFRRPELRAIFFNQPYATLQNEKNNGCDLSQEYQDKAFLFIDDKAAIHSPICFAVSIDNLTQVKHLTQLGVSLEVSVKMKVKRYGGSIGRENYQSYNLVNLAAYYQHHSIVRFLLQQLEGRLDLTETCRQTFLAGDLGGLTCLFECGIDIDFKALRENHTLIWDDFLLRAVDHNCISLIKIIHHVLPDLGVVNGPTTVINMLDNASSDSHFELFNILLTLFNDPDLIKERCKEIGRDVDSARELESYLRSGVRVNLKKLTRHTEPDDLETILSNAVKTDSLFLVRGLLAVPEETGHTNPSTSSSKRLDPGLLIKTAKFGYADMVSLLLQEGAKVDKPNYKKETALSLAIKNGHLPVVKILVKNGANPQPGLIPALFEGQIEIADYLFETMTERGQFLSLADENELRTVLKQVVIKDQSSVIEFLNNKIFPDRVAINWNYLFRTAIIGGQLKLAKLYIEKKYVDIHTPLFHENDTTPYSPLTYAITFGCRLEIVWYLLKNGAPVQDQEWDAANLYFQQHNGQEGNVLRRLLQRYSQQESVNNTATLFYNASQSTDTAPPPDLAPAGTGLNL